MKLAIALLLVLLAPAAFAADDLRRADELAWAKRFAEAEALYRALLPSHPEARLGLARVVMWQGRYREAAALFDAIQPPTVESIEGRATAAYWSGDYRGAARDFRRVLVLDPQRELALRSLAEIMSTAPSSQRVAIDAIHDDQPLDGVRVEASAAFFSDPLTRWSARGGTYRIEGHSGEFAAIENETTFGRWNAGASAGIFEFPDGVRRPIGSAHIRLRSLTLAVDRHEELATLTALRTHVASTTTALRWHHDQKWIGAVEASHLEYSDHNQGWGFVAYAVLPVVHEGAWTLWSGASMNARDTDQSRFVDGRYDPYWTPDDLREARAVFAVERELARGRIKLHGDAGAARDRGRDYHPYRGGLSAEWRVAGALHFEIGVERGVTIDYRSTAIHAAVVRRR